MQPELFTSLPLEEILANELAVERKRNADLMRNIRALLARLGEEGVCTGAHCGAAIYWVRHPNRVLTPYSLDGQNHFADCPDRDQFRRRKDG
jgi:hypothetical protein